MALTLTPEQEKLLAYQSFDISGAEKISQSKGFKSNYYGGGGQFTQIQEDQKQLNQSLQDIAELTNPKNTWGSQNQLDEATRIATRMQGRIQGNISSLPDYLQGSLLPNKAPDTSQFDAYNFGGGQSFADIRAGGDPNDIFIIEKNGKQREASRSQLSDSFAKAGFTIVGEAGRKKTFAPTQEETQTPNFIGGLSDAQKQSITNLMSSRPSSQWSDTDIKNWNYATNGQALPTGQPTTTEQPTTQTGSTQYTTEFERLWANLNPTFEKSEANKAATFEQYQEMGSSGTVGSTTTDETQNNNINFISGLTQEQKNSIINLTTRLSSDQWSQTDIDNWNYATNNQALPSGTPLVPAGADVNDGVTPDETTPPDETTDPTDETTPETTTGLDDAGKQELRDYVKNQNYPIEYQAILFEMIDSEDNYITGNTILTKDDIGKIVTDAAVSAEQNLSPYYEKITGRTMDDLKQSMADLRGSAERYKEQETMNYKDTLAKTKQNLRSRGLTFSGTSRKTLGAEGAIEAKGVEGVLPAERRLGYEDLTAQYQQKARELGTPAERTLGSETIQGVDFGKLSTPYGQRELYTPTGNTTTGDLTLDRLKAIKDYESEYLRSYKPFI